VRDVSLFVISLSSVWIVVAFNLYAGDLLRDLHAIATAEQQIAENTHQPIQVQSIPPVVLDGLRDAGTPVKKGKK
jgi:hypothetical protein